MPDVTPLVLTSFTAVNALGRGSAAVLESLTAARTGLKPCSFEQVQLETWVGEVAGLDDLRVCERLAEFDCRNNRLAELALEQDGFAARIAQAREKYGAHRIAVILGTSTSGILETEHAYR
jgi:3-oxoacyl-[acyl-carrier-protein] synthase-1